MKPRIYFRAAAILVLISGMTVKTVADPGDSLWSHTYGGPINDFAFAVTPSGDGNYLLAGVTNDNYGVGGDLWLLKVDAPGDLIWSRIYGGSGFDCAIDLIPSGDGNFLVAGQTSSFSPGEGVWLVKVDAQGDSLWSRTYYGGYAWSITPSGDGGFLVVGSVDRFGTGLDDMFLMKVNAQGDSLWSHVYGGTGSDYGLGIAPADDGGFLLVGYSNSFNPWGYDVRLVKVNAQGDSLWSRNFGGMYLDQAFAVTPAGDGGFLVAGMTASYALNDLWLVKVSAQGDSLWSRTYGGSGYEWANAIIPSGDDGFLLAGTTNSFGSGWYDMWLLKVNAQGDSLWSHTYGGPYWDEAYAITLSDDGDVLLAGKTYSFGAGWHDMWLVKAEGSGSPPTSVEIRMVPSGSTTIPPGGGSFNFNATVDNVSTEPQSFQVWIMTRLPNQSWYGPVLGPLSLTLPAGGSVTRLRSQSVPGSAPAGSYWYEGRVGDYPNAIWDASGFAFTKLGSENQISGFSEWFNTGEPFSGEVEDIPNSSLIIHNLNVSPNPFNPTTVLSFELRAASHVTLEVFDVNGRSIHGWPGQLDGRVIPAGPATQAGKWYPAGTHQIPFDGSDLPSGIYFVKLLAGEQSAVQKLVLLK